MSDAPYSYTLDPASTAVLVIDMQVEFCSRDGFFAHAGLGASHCIDVVPAVRALLELARARGLTVVFTRTVNVPESVLPRQHRILPVRDRHEARTTVCLEGTPGVEIVDELRPLPSELVVDKRQYSAFYETPLEHQLRQRGIDTLVVAGVTTHACVDSTVRDAYFRGFDIVIASDAVAAFEPELHASTLRTLELLFGAVSPVDEIDRALSGADDDVVAGARG